MPSNTSSDSVRPPFNFTEISTRRLLIGVGLTCAVLWAVIAATVSL